jgi:hypothetical protein
LVLSKFFLCHGYIIRKVLGFHVLPVFASNICEEKLPLPVFDTTLAPGGRGMAYITIKAKIDSFIQIAKVNRFI